MAAKTNVKVYVYFGGHIIPDDWVVQYSIAHKTAFRIKRDLSFAQFLSKLYQRLDVDVNQFGLRVCCKSYIYNGERMREMITEMTTDEDLQMYIDPDEGNEAIEVFVEIEPKYIDSATPQVSVEAFDLNEPYFSQPEVTPDFLAATQSIPNYCETSGAREVHRDSHTINYSELDPEFTWMYYSELDPEFGALIEYPEIVHPQLWLSSCPLIFYERVEMHRPYRVLRQFGRIQHIPPHPTDHDVEIKLHSYDRRGAGGRDWARFHRIYVDRWHGRLDSPVDYPFIEFSGPQTDPGYYEWYERHTRRLISPIDNLDDIGFQVGDPILLDLVGNQLISMSLAARAAQEARDWARFHRIYVDRWHGRLDSPVDYPFIEFSGPQTDPGYYEWYERHTRRLISPIDNLDDIGFQVGDPILLDLVGNQLISMSLAARAVSRDDDQIYDLFQDNATRMYAAGTQLLRRDGASSSLPPIPAIPPIPSPHRDRHVPMHGGMDDLSTTQGFMDMFGASTSQVPIFTDLVGPSTNDYVPDMPWSDSLATPHPPAIDTRFSSWGPHLELNLGYSSPQERIRPQYNVSPVPYPPDDTQFVDDVPADPDIRRDGRPRRTRRAPACGTGSHRH
ncbi:PREDICTED: uncharacterized protein LOC105955342 [Erythranthe guttata]|uniref:uncharacterized protein LOC105955342 n=1 Tax=Erythranthe guttata TaxID=4155 RepID=UPI00064DBFDF|nr:PREDICTED: uncharacterized protein LOC105955342 [Erythranthe guttata]|eukprot:XP_012834512.1 PREDICTED: uncharacterized protein LOC105955342 [Erythranthe guttata]